MSIFRNVPLLWKIVGPFAVLVVVVGSVGMVLISRTLSARAETALDQQLGQLALTARSSINARELYVVESVNLAANLSGVADAAARRSPERLTELLRSVVSVKQDLDFVAVADGTGSALVVMGSGGRPVPVASVPVPVEGRPVRFASIGGQPALTAGAPICSVSPCEPDYFALVAIHLSDFIPAAAAGAITEADANLGLFDDEGNHLASSAPVAGTKPPVDVPDGGVRISRDGVTTLFAPVEMQGHGAAVLSVSLPTSAAYATARDAATRFAAVLFVVILGIVATAVMVTRRILAQLRPLVETNRRLGAGEFHARAPVLSGDELGELAAGVNAMAEQLEESYSTLEHRVQERTGEVRRLMRERSDFFAAITHDIRTPLAVILGQAGRVKDEETAATIRSSAQQIKSMVEDVLELARAEEGRLVVDASDVDVLDIVAGLRPTLEPLASARGIALKFELGDGPAMACADPIRVREVIMTLVDNALKYTPCGGSVDVLVEARPEGVRVTVADTGVGIPADIGDDLFRPFFRVPGIQPLHGELSTGLGLALAKRLVEAQHGTISYESEPGVGTSFTFVVPGAARRRRRSKNPAQADDERDRRDHRFALQT